MVGPNARGLPNDTAAALTSVVAGSDLNTLGQPPVQSLGYEMYDDNWRYYFNHTLPYGFFSRSPMEWTGRFSISHLPLFWLHHQQAIHKPYTSGNPTHKTIVTSRTIFVLMCCIESARSLWEDAKHCALLRSAVFEAVV